MAHGKAELHNKPQRDMLGKDEVGTFSQCGEYYDYSKFTPKKCLIRKGAKKRGLRL